ncbi:MAG: hypothetical protein Q9175_006926 [Cornicularia normoerica]
MGETVDKITLRNGTPITVSGYEYTSPNTVQPCGVLAVYLSEAKARKEGKEWLYGQLKALGVGIDLPPPMQDGSECTEADWRRSGWRRTADGSWGYSISDYSLRKLALVVYLGPVGSRKRVLAKNEKNDNGGTATEDQDADDGDDTARERESEDAEDEVQDYEEDEIQDQEDLEMQDQDDNGGYVEEAKVEKA